MADMTVHPNRYPKHDNAEKGQVHGGVCNTTACVMEGAIYWNAMTFGFYCRRCAEGINFKDTICRPVGEKPSIQQMEKIRRETVKEASW